MMSTSSATESVPSKTYGPPAIPKTPSPTINKMLEERFNKKFNNPIKAAVAFFLCSVFQAITMLYQKINQEKDRDSHTFWMASCGAVSVGIALASFLLYQIVMACSFLIHALLYYGCVLFALFGMGLGIAGAVFFNKDNVAKSASGSQDHSKYY